MSDDVNFPSDETLFEILRISQRDIEKIPASAEELRLARALVPPPRLRHDGRIEHAVALLASAMGRMPQYNPTHLPFGYQGPIIKSSGWLDRDDLDLVAKQIVGLTWIDSKPDDVACVVGQAISSAISLSLIEQTKYDAWRPGMASGSGWREAVSATTYGVAKARAMGERQVEATAQPPVSSAPVQRPAQDPPWARQPKPEADDGRAQVKEAAPAQAPRDPISKKTRIEFREFLVGWSLREISDEFDAADIACDRDYVPNVTGERRSLVEQYYHTLHFTSPTDVQKLVKAYENILTSALNKAAKIESDGYPDPSLATQLRQAVNSLSAWLKKDGYTFENGAIAPIDTVAKQQDEPVSQTISEVTRRDIFDALRLENVQWAGRLSEIKFLERLYNLEFMSSTEYRYQDNVAGEIWQHRVNNPSDWPDDWIFTDSRFGLTDGPDDTLLRFLCEMVHPLVQPDRKIVESLVAIFSEHLAADGWKITKCREISGKPVFGPRRIIRGAGEVQATCGMAVDGGMRVPKLGEDPRSAQRQSERQDPNDDLVELLDDANYCIMALADLGRDYGIIAAASSRTEGGSEDWHFVDHRDESEYREAHRRIKPTMDVLPRRMKQVLRWGLRHGFEVSEDLGFLTYDRASAGVKADACRDYELAIRGVMNAMLAEQTRARIAESVGCGELGANATDQVFEDSPEQKNADKPELNASAEPQADTTFELPDEPFGPPEPAKASGGMDAWIKAEMERICQEDDGPYMTPPPSTEPRDVRVLWIERAARDLAEGFPNTLAEKDKWWVRIQNADRAQNPVDQKESRHQYGNICRMLQAQRRLAGRVFNGAIILLPVQATADAEIIRNLPHDNLSPEQVRQAVREWNRIGDAAVRERNATAQAVPGGQNAAADTGNWVFEDLPDGEVRARNRRLCERYAALNLEDLLLLCHQWRQMAIRFTEATKKAGKYHGHVVHDEKVQEVTKILETAMVSRQMEGTNRLSRCLRRPDDGHLHNALAALDDLEAKLRLETCESGVLNSTNDVEDEDAGSDSQQTDTLEVPAPSTECYAELDAPTADKGMLKILFTKPAAGRPTEAGSRCVEKQQLAILLAGVEAANRRRREADYESPSDRLPEQQKTVLQWSQDSLQDLVKGNAGARRGAMARVRRLVRFQDGVWLVTDQDKGTKTWTSTVPFRLRVTDDV